MADIINIFLIDEQVVVSQGLQLIINGSPEMRVAGEAHHATEALRIVNLLPIDVIVFDVVMKNGVDLLLTLRKDFPHIPVLILSHHCEDATCLRLIRSGAAGCLCKTRSVEDLFIAIRKIFETGKFISEQVALYLADQLNSGTGTSPHTLLSEREFQVFKKLSSGTDNKEIALELFLSPKTVSTYKKRVLEKLKCKNISELTRYALAENIL